MKERGGRNRKIETEERQAGAKLKMKEMKGNKGRQRREEGRDEGEEG